MTPLEQLQTAGFSEQEIGKWATEQRSTLQQAGFADAEIDHYFAGPKEPVPPILLRRLEQSKKTFDDLSSVGLTVVSGGLGMLVDFITDPLAPLRTLVSPDLEHLEQSVRPHPGQAATELAHKLTDVPEFKPQTAEGRVGLATAQGAVAGGPFGLIGAAGGALMGLAGQTTMEVTGSERAATAAGLIAGLVPGGALLVRRGNTLARIEPDPTAGGLRETPIGGLPEPTDFTAASQIVMGSPVPRPPIVEKLRHLWRQYGIHPSEVAHDAARDPTIAQDLASATTELPSAYAGEKQPRATLPGPEPDAVPSGIAELRPGELRIDPERFQFKAGTDLAGVNERLLDIDTWDPIKAGLGIVFEDRDGVRWIADGHQRLGLANRIEAADPAQRPRLNAWVLREADGYTDVDVRAIAAGKNIAEGTGTVVDAAKVLRDRPDLLPSLPPRSETVRQATALSNLDAEAFGKVVNDVVPPNYAAIVGRLVPDDPVMQNAVIDLLAKTKPANVVQAEAIVRQGLVAGTRTERQATLFGDEEVTSSLYSERARVLDNALRMLRSNRALFETLVDNARIIEDLGNRLAGDANARQAAIDGHASQTLQTLANRVGPLSDALTATARDLASGKSLAAVSRDFVDAIRRQAESGALSRGADGRPGGAVEAPRAGRAARAKPAPVAAERNPRVVTPAEEARAAEQIAETIRPEPQPGAFEDPLVLAQRGELTAERAAQIRDELATLSPADLARAKAQIGEHVDLEMWTVIADNLRKAEGSREGAIEVIADQLQYLPPEIGAIRTASEREAAAVISRAMEAETARGGDVAGLLDAAGVGEQKQQLLLLARGIDPADLFRFPDPNAPPAGMSINWPRRGLTPAEETVLSHIEVGGRRARHPLSWTSLYTNMVDRLNALPDRDTAGARIPTPDNPYRLMRMLSGDPGKSQGWLKLGQVDYATGNKIGPSLQEILAPVRNDLNPLRAFMDSVRALELEGKGIPTGFDQAAIRQVATAGMREFGPVMARLIEYQNNLLKYMRDAGVLSDQAYTDIVAKHQTYVPFHAVLDEASQRFGGGTLQPNNPLYRIEGSQRVKIDPLESILEHTYQYVSMAERNRAATAMVDLLASRGEAIPATAATVAERQVRTFDKGTEKLWEVERDIADTVKSIDGDAAGFLARWLGSDRAELRTAAQLVTLPARTLRAGATLSPDFLLRNPIRDYFTALLQSEKPVFTPWDQVKGLYSTVMRDEYFRRWSQGGGGSAELVAMDRRYLQEDLRKLNQDTGLMSRGWNVVRNPLDILRTVSEYSERATRLGEFRYVYDRELRRGATPDEASRTAAYASREVSVDFSRRGAVTQSLNMIDAFWNASVQGSDRFVRQMRDHPYTTGLKVAAGITLPSTLLWWANHDDPRWKEMPAWQRDLFWIVMTDKWNDMGPAAGQADVAPYAHGGTSWRVRGGRYERNDGAIFRLPKPFEPGIVFGSGIERLLDAYFTDNPDQLASWSKSVAASVLPVPGSSLGAPMLEQYANRSLLTDSNLIPQYLEKELPEYQYQPYTTETAKALGQLIAAFPGMREVATGHSQAAGVARALTTPILLEHYVRAWTGGGGMYLLKIADSALRQNGIVPDPPKPTDTLADIPVIKAFVIRYPSGGAASIQRFYDDYGRNQRYFTSWQARAREGDIEAMQRIQEAGGPRLFVQLDGIREAMGQQAKVIRDISKNPQITPDEKRQLIDTLYFGQIELARNGVQTMRQVDLALAPGPPPPTAQQPAMTQPPAVYRQPSPGSLPINP